MAHTTDDGGMMDRPWLPGGLARHGFTTTSVQRLSYIVVDEMVGGDVGLSILPWPGADARGRVRFRNLDEGREVGTALKELQAVYKLLKLKRDPRVGDVFAAELDWAGAGLDPDAGREDLVTAVAKLVKGAIYDLSADARLAAKLACYAAMTAVIPRKTVKEWNLGETVERVEKRAPAVEMNGETAGGG